MRGEFGHGIFERTSADGEVETHRGGVRRSERRRRARRPRRGGHDQALGPLDPVTPFAGAPDVGLYARDQLYLRLLT